MTSAEGMEAVVFKHLKLGTRIGGGFGLLAFLTLWIGLFGYYGAVSSSGSVDQIGRVRMPGVDAAVVLNSEANAIRTAQSSLLIPGMTEDDRRRQYAAIEKALAAI